VNLDVPLILVGGNRDIERLEGIVRESHAEFISLCRPLISEPVLPRRWLEGRGSNSTDCISCNSCLMNFMNGGFPQSIYKHNRTQFRALQDQLASRVNDNRVK
jgi:2,4-dienoyl-CoA reductase-like NADH-dependent reductase (Old Yellow Enzyme family)